MLKKYMEQPKPRSPYLFSNRRGTLPVYIDDDFKRAVNKAGLKDFRFHDLRHCAATNLRRAGVDTVTAMKIVGHKSEKMHRRYNSVSEEDLTKAAGKLNTYLSNTVITPAESSHPPISVSV